MNCVISAWSGDGVFGICGMAGTFRALALLPERVCMKVWTGCLATSRTRYVALIDVSDVTVEVSILYGLVVEFFDFKTWFCCYFLLQMKSVCYCFNMMYRGRSASMVVMVFSIVGGAGVSRVLRIAGFPLQRALMQRTLSGHHFSIVLNFAGRFLQHVSQCVTTFPSEKNIVLMKLVCLTLLSNDGAFTFWELHWLSVLLPFCASNLHCNW